MGDTFYAPTNQRGMVAHLWFIISEPDSTGHMVTVNMTDYANNRGDTNCELNIGDHAKNHQALPPDIN